MGLVVVTAAVTVAMVYGLVYSSLSGHPAITEPWEETKAMAGGIVTAAALVFVYGAVALRGLQAPRSRSWWREAVWCAWIAAPPAWLTWTSCRPGGFVWVSMSGFPRLASRACHQLNRAPERRLLSLGRLRSGARFRDMLLVPLPIAAPATLAFVLSVLTLASRSLQGVEPAAEEPAVSPR
ncbi:MAG: hypothetical protein AB7T09_25430 [Planctomycetota bacterium]